MPPWRPRELVRAAAGVSACVLALVALTGCEEAKRWVGWGLGPENTAPAPVGGDEDAEVAASASTPPDGPSKRIRPGGAAVDAPSGDAQVAPSGYVRVEVAAVTAAGDGAAVLLSDDDGARVMPIFVGGTEALSIALRLEHERYARPLTHDLLDSMVESLGGRAVKVQVDELKDSVYYGSVYFEQEGKLRSIDARPSDAIAIALGNGIPIYVAKPVMDTAAVEGKGVLGPEGTPPRRGPDSDPLSL